MDNITRITALGMCTGCGACLNCEHLHLERSSLGFDIPVPDEGLRDVSTAASALRRACSPRKEKMTEQGGLRASFLLLLHSGGCKKRGEGRKGTKSLYIPSELQYNKMI